MQAAREVSRVGYRGGARQVCMDQVAEEEPLEIRVQGTPIAVLMRTPGDDEDLVRGFLCTEGIVASVSHIRRIAPCDVATSAESADNVIQVRLQEGIRLDVESLRRNLYASSSCGICGKATLEQVRLRVPPLVDETRVPSAVWYRLPEALRQAQTLFASTGGVHAAGLFTAAGHLLALREDVGRHNAVDKAIGALLAADRLAEAPLLLVSGRISFEVVQKAAAARIPLVAGISAPTSLAVRLAEELGMTLVGFLRSQQMNVYAGAHRIPQQANSEPPMQPSLPRVPEPELMDDDDQAQAYAAADFAASDAAMIERIEALFPRGAAAGGAAGREPAGAGMGPDVVDLGCGPGNICQRLAEAWPDVRLVGVDGSVPMLRWAARRRRDIGLPEARLRYECVRLPGPIADGQRFSGIVSNSLLHHLHDPAVLWDTVRAVAAPGARVYVRDLRRPATLAEVDHLVAAYVSGEPEGLQQDFRNSLHAAFTPDEVRDQLARAGLLGLEVAPVEDRYLEVHGILP